MIKLPGGYAITADGRQYALNKIYVAGKDAKGDRKPGEEYPIAFKWFSTMTGVCKAVVSLYQREQVESGAVTTLQDAARAFKEIQAKIEAMVFPGEG